MATISSLGVGSGIDLQSLVDGLVSAERSITEASLNRREVLAAERLSAFGLIKSAVSEFNGALTSLGDITTFQKRTVDTGGSTEVAVSASADAALGSFTVDVLDAGAAQLLTGSGLLDNLGAALANASTNIGGGTLTIGQGGQPSFNVEIDAAASSLNDIADAINSAEGNTGVQASVVNSDSGPSIVISSNSAGTDNEILITVSDLDGNDTDALGLSQLTFDAANIPGSNLSQATAAANAQIEVNGLTVTSTDGNQFSDAIEGITITANEVTTSTVSVSIGNDTSQATEALRNFVDEFNKLIDIIKEVTQVSVGDDAVSSGVLVGDSLVRSIESQLRRTIFTEFRDGQPLGIRNFSDIGVRFGDGGKLALDETVLQANLDEDFDSVARLLAGAEGIPSETTETIETTYQLNSIDFNNQNVRVGRGDLTISVGGDSFTLNIDNSNRRVFQIRDAINAAIDNTGVTASLITTVGDDVQLQLLANDPGRQIVVTVDDNDGNDIDLNGLSRIASVNMTETQNQETVETVIPGIDGVDGIVTGLQASINAFLGVTERGSLDARTDGLNADLERISDARDALDRRIEALQERLTAQYANLDLLVSNLQSSGNFLLSQLNSISQISTNNNSRS